MIRTQISMTERQAIALRRLAAARHKSQAAVLRDALDDLIAEDEQAARIDRARHAVGGFRSGHHDTSEDHDKVLSDAFER